MLEITSFFLFASFSEKILLYTPSPQPDVDECDGLILKKAEEKAHERLSKYYHH